MTYVPFIHATNASDAFLSTLAPRVKASRSVLPCCVLSALTSSTSINTLSTERVERESERGKQREKVKMRVGKKNKTKEKM